MLEEDPLKRMTLAEALDHPWLASYRDENYDPNAIPASTTRPGTPELRETNPDSSILTPAPGSFSEVKPSLRHSPSRVDNGDYNADLSLEENGNLGLNGLQLSPQKRNFQQPQPSSSDMPGAYPKASGSRAAPLERRASVLERQQMEEEERANGVNNGTPTTPGVQESWQIVEAPVASPKAGEKRRARPASQEDENGSDAINEAPMAGPMPKMRKRNASSGKPKSKVAPGAAASDSAPQRRSARNKKA